MIVRSVGGLQSRDRIVAIGGHSLPVPRVVRAVEPRSALLEHPEPNPHGVEWRLYADQVAEEGVEVERDPHPPATRPERYQPKSGLTAFQKRVLERLSTTEPKRAIDLGLGDPRGVGASLAALHQRGYVCGDGKRGWVRADKVSPVVRQVQLMYHCDGCNRWFYPAEVRADLMAHEQSQLFRCPDQKLRPVDR